MTETASEILARCVDNERSHQSGIGAGKISHDLAYEVYVLWSRKKSSSRRLALEQGHGERWGLFHREYYDV